MSAIAHGPKHYRTNDDGDYEQCRCMIGEGHGNSEVEKLLTVEDAADIWLTHGMGENDTFGFGEDELGRAAGQD